ncbi:MAG: hypothetical protein AAF518_15970 [Spirochaetota bacterium]
MKLRKILYLFTIFISLSSFLGGCNGKDSNNDLASILARFSIRNAILSDGVTSSLDNLPSDVTVSVPRSIRSSSSSGTSNSVLASRTYSGVLKNARNTNNISAEGFQAINEAMGKLLGYAGETKYEFLLLDKLFAKAISSGQTGVCIPGDQKVPVSQDALDTIVSSFETLGLTTEEAKVELASRQSEQTLPTAGASVTTPAYKVNVLTNDPAGFDYEILYKQGATINDTSVCPGSDSGFTKFLRFNKDKTLVQYSLRKSLEIPGLEITVTPVLFLDKSGTKPKTVLTITLVRNQSGRKARVVEKTTMQQCDVNDENNTRCRRMSFSLEVKNPPKPGSTTVSGSYDFKTEVSGKLTNNGGFIKATIEDKSTGSSTKLYTKEVFDANQTLVAKQVSTDGRNWTDVLGTIDLNSLGTTLGDTTFDNFSGFGIGEQVYLSFSGQVTGITADNEYVIVAGQSSPSTYSDPFSVIIGNFYAFDQDSSGTITSNDLLLNYWGTAAQVSNLSLWQVTYDTDFNATYTQITGNVIQQTTTSPFANPSSPYYDPYLVDYGDTAVSVDNFGPTGSTSGTCYQFDGQGQTACESNSAGLDCVYSSTNGWCDPNTGTIDISTISYCGDFYGTWDQTGCTNDSFCSWDGTTCKDVTSTSGYCESLGSNSSSCLSDSSPCRWNGSTCVTPAASITDSFSVCPTITDPTTCAEEPLCYYSSGGTCVNLTSYSTVECSQIDTDASGSGAGSYKDIACQSAGGFYGCSWDGVNCTSGGASGCASNANLEACHNDAVSNGFEGCVWDGSTCNNAGSGGVGCLANTNITSCITDSTSNGGKGCTYYDNSPGADFCRPALDTTQCLHYDTDSSACTNEAACSFGAMCLGSTMCSHYPSQLDCDSAAGYSVGTFGGICTWNSGMFTCDP